MQSSRGEQERAATRIGISDCDAKGTLSCDDPQTFHETDGRTRTTLELEIVKYIYICIFLSFSLSCMLRNYFTVTGYCLVLSVRLQEFSRLCKGYCEKLHRSSHSQTICRHLARPSYRRADTVSNEYGVSYSMFTACEGELSLIASWTRDETAETMPFPSHAQCHSEDMLTFSQHKRGKSLADRQTSYVYMVPIV